jgi:hypothetical protein
MPKLFTDWATKIAGIEFKRFSHADYAAQTLA